VTDVWKSSEDVGEHEWNGCVVDPHWSHICVASTRQMISSENEALCQIVSDVDVT
jgi:hypothetical protein